jgi:hypothetical protein
MITRGRTLEDLPRRVFLEHRRRSECARTVRRAASGRRSRWTPNDGRKPVVVRRERRPYRWDSGSDTVLLDERRPLVGSPLAADHNNGRIPVMVRRERRPYRWESEGALNLTARDRSKQNKSAGQLYAARRLCYVWSRGACRVQKLAGPLLGCSWLDLSLDMPPRGDALPGPGVGRARRSNGSSVAGLRAPRRQSGYMFVVLPVASQYTRPPKAEKLMPLTDFPSRPAAEAGSSRRTQPPAAGRAPAL